MRVKWVNNDLHVIVGDNGIGIPRKHLETIRKTFETGDFKGIGVGNIYKRIRSNMWKGSMTISSKENMGTIIRILGHKNDPPIVLVFHIVSPTNDFTPPFFTYFTNGYFSFNL